jgi:hypothetical protein
VAGAEERAGFLDGRAAFSQGRSGLYDVGDKVVYPHHGAGTVVKKEKREVLGQQREYLTIKILHNDMTVQVPSENAEKVGLRRVIGEKEVGVVLKALTGSSSPRSCGTLPSATARRGSPPARSRCSSRRRRSSPRS